MKKSVLSAEQNFLNFQLLNGNNDRHTVVSHVLPKPIIARYIRIHPKAWHGHVSMRVGLYGCTKGMWFYCTFMMLFSIVPVYSCDLSN